jgi:coenzyme F420 hydrogenase subunit beta
VRATKSSNEVTSLFKTVVEGGYCIGCGACTAVQGSPISIELDEYGRFCATLDIDSNLHEANVKVLSVCPFSDQALNEDEIGRELYREKAIFDDRIGYYLTTYAGFVTEADFRARGSSGGMGKWILYELFRENLVDAVIQVGRNILNESNRLLYKYHVSESTSEIKSGSKSVYYPVEMSGILQYIREHPGCYAIVGVPCFIKAIRLLSMHDSILGERMRFCVGLMCGHLKSTRYADMFAWQSGIEPGNLTSIDFRVKLPGRKANEKGVEIAGLQNGEKVSRVDIVQEFFGTDYNLGFFKYQACDFCDDVVAETADITIGDAWLPEYLEDSKGANVVIVRHPEIQGLIEQGISSDRLRLEYIDPDRVVKSQEAGFRHRRDGLAYRLYLKDRAGVWRPPKRVKAQYDHLTRRRRRIYEFRIRMTLKSHEAFEKAIEMGDFSVFQKEMEILLSKYAGLYRPPLWRRVLRRALRKLRSMLRRFCQEWVV